MHFGKAVDFLLENAGDVIKYRLHTEILRDVSDAEGESLLSRVLDTPRCRLLESYAKSNGYIGIGMHSWDKFKESPLQDGEAAARQISYYAIPKSVPLVAEFARALTDDELLEGEFAYYNPEIKRFKNRRLGMKSGSSLQLLIDTSLALIGCGDGIIDDTTRLSLEAFASLLPLKSLDEITKFNPKSAKKYNYPHVEADAYLPCVYHLQILSHTNSWRTPENMETLARALNHQQKITHEGARIHVKLGSDYYIPLWALIEPIKPYEPDSKRTMSRRMLTDIAKAGVGKRLDATKETAERLVGILEKEGVVRMGFASAYEKRRYKGDVWPTPYNEVTLEADYKSDTNLWCDLTFWAVQFMHYYMNAA